MTEETPNESIEEQKGVPQYHASEEMKDANEHSDEVTDSTVNDDGVVNDTPAPVYTDVDSDSSIAETVPMVRGRHRSAQAHNGNDGTNVLKGLKDAVCGMVTGGNAKRSSRRRHASSSMPTMLSMPVVDRDGYTPRHAVVALPRTVSRKTMLIAGAMALGVMSTSIAGVALHGGTGLREAYADPVVQGGFVTAASTEVSRGDSREPLGTVTPSVSVNVETGTFKLGDDGEQMKENLMAQASSFDKMGAAKDALKKLVDEASQKTDDTNYTSDSWKAMQDALGPAKDALGKDANNGDYDALSKAYDDARNKLQSALDGLVLKPRITSSSSSGGGAGSLGTTVPVGEKQKWFHDYLLSNGYTEADFSAGVWIINHESGWNEFATNPSSGAYGLPQSLPGNKMASMGDDWKTNYQTQLKWFIWYCNTRYNGISGAYSYWLSHSWY